MSQDLLDDFFSPRPASVRPNPTPFGAPLFNPPPKSISRLQGHQRTDSATSFDDLLVLGLFDTQSPAPSLRPQPAHLSKLTQSQRPVSFHGGIPSNTDRDPFAVLRSFTPSNAFTSTQRPASISTFDDFFVAGSQRNAAEEEDDDFGDFASASPSASFVTATARFSNSTPPRLSNSSPPPPPTPPKPGQRRKVSETDIFGDFVTSPTTSSPLSPAFSSPPRVPSIPLRSFGSIPAPSPLRRPPKPQSSVPPVSVLLRAFPHLFLLPQECLLDKMTDLSFPLRQRVLAHPSTRKFLDGVCEIGRVAGRIIAGRKRRVKRLPTPGKGERSGGGGMKLGSGFGAAWDIQKEEREVKEICRLWKEGSGRLKAAVGVGVPEFGDEAVRSSGTDGCKLCGLGEGDLLPGLKEKNDRLGWWDREWGGHGGCRGFWDRHGKSLVSAGR